MKAFFHDGQVIVCVDCPFEPDELYMLWRSHAKGARIKVPIKAGKRHVYVDIVHLDANKTFEDVILGNYPDTIRPPS